MQAGICSAAGEKPRRVKLNAIGGCLPSRAAPRYRPRHGAPSPSLSARRHCAPGVPSRPYALPPALSPSNNGTLTSRLAVRVSRLGQAASGTDSRHGHLPGARVLHCSLAFPAPPAETHFCEHDAPAPAALRIAPDEDSDRIGPYAVELRLAVRPSVRPAAFDLQFLFPVDHLRPPSAPAVASCWSRFQTPRSGLSATTAADRDIVQRNLVSKVDL